MNDTMTTELTKAAQQALEALARIARIEWDAPMTFEEKSSRLEAAVSIAASALTQRPAAQTERDTGPRVLREVFALCEDTMDKMAAVNTEFSRGRAFEAKGISRAIGTWFQDEYCGQSHMGEPSLPAPQQATPEPEHITVQEAWEAAGGNPGIKASKAELLEALRQLDKVCDEATPEPVACKSCESLARTVMLDQASSDQKPVAYGIHRVDAGEADEEWEDIRTSPDRAREEADDMMATGRGEIYEVIPLYAKPAHPAPAPQPVGEVVAWMHTSGVVHVRHSGWPSQTVEAYTPAKGWAPLYTRPAPGVPEGVLSVCAKVAESPEVEEALCHYVNDESDTLTIAWLVEVILKQALAAAQAKGGEHG